METIELFAEFAVSPRRVYEAWLDSTQHGAMIGATASVEPWVGGQHSAWDGYSWGRILELEPGRRIVQSWRTTEFPPGSEDSRLEILLEPTALGSRMTLRQSHIPAGQGTMYRDGWEETYFRPMRAYFRSAMPTPEPMMAPIEAPKPAPVSAPKKAAKVVARKAKPRKKVARKARKKAARKATKKVARKGRTARKAGARRVRKTRAKVAKRVRRAKKTRARVAKRARRARKTRRSARKTRR